MHVLFASHLPSTEREFCSVYVRYHSLNDCLFAFTAVTYFLLLLLLHTKHVAAVKANKRMDELINANRTLKLVSIVGNE